MSSILIDSDNLNKDIQKNKYRIDINKSAFKFFSNLTKDENDLIEDLTEEEVLKKNIVKRNTLIIKKILAQIYIQPGLINNMILNLNNPDDDDTDVVTSVICIIGNMCFHLKKFLKSKFMIDTGTYNLIAVFLKLNSTDVKVETSIALRKATQSREQELLNSFINNGIIEAVIKVLN